MKKAIIILSLILVATLFSCEEGDFGCPAVPGPNTNPNDTDIYEDQSSGYKSVTYTYYCLNGQYTAITWTRTEKCGFWYKSIYTSSCIK